MNAWIVERTEVSQGLMVLRVIPDEPLSFIPGQFVNIGLDLGGRMLHRAYSIVSAPSDRYLEFFIERVPNGNLTPLIWELKPGEALQLVTRAAGVLTLEEGSQHHLFLATATGAAPFISILRHEKYIRSQGKNRLSKYLLIHGASRPEDFGPYRAELEELAQEEWFTYVPTVSRFGETQNWSSEVGRVEDIIRKYSDSRGFTTERTASYVCGHPEMVKTAEQVLLRAGLPKHHISTERYFRLSN